MARFSCSMRDAAEQHRVHHDRVPVPRHPQRDFLVDLQDRRIGVRRDQVVEHGRDLGEQLAGALQRRDGVGEVRHGGIVGDRRDLGGMVGEGLLEGRQEVLRLDLGERRRLERRLPRLEQRICSGFRSGCRLAGFLTSQYPVFCLENMRQSISRDAAFLGLLRLIEGAFSERLRPSNRTFSMSPQPASTSSRADRLAERHHRHLGGDPDRRRGVRRGVCRRLGARDPVRPRRHRRAHPAGGAVRASAC